MSLLNSIETKEMAMPRGRKIKPSKAPARHERLTALRERIAGLGQELIERGFGSGMAPPGGLTTYDVDQPDPKTGGKIGKVKEKLGTYIQRVSVKDNFSQRPPFDHVTDPIYRRLIRDFLDGAVLPESKVAAMTQVAGKAERLDSDETLRYSVVDGLQRLYCECIAVLLTLERDNLVNEGLITADAWEYFKGHIQGGPKEATEALLQREIRYEVFYGIDLSGLLHYMVTFNTGQRRMDLRVQLEIMQRTLIDEFLKAGIPVWEEMKKDLGRTRPKDQFDAKDLVMATRAFITSDPHVSAAEEAEGFLENQAALDNVGDIDDVVATLKRITKEMQPLLMKVYAEDPNLRYILSGGGLFLLGLAAACGYVRNRNNAKMLEGALDKLLTLLKRPVEDPWNLNDYAEAMQSITSSRGKTTRRLVYETFSRFFNGGTLTLDWRDTARLITGGRD